MKQINIKVAHTWQHTAFEVMYTHVLFLNTELNMKQIKVYTNPPEAKVKYTIVIAICSGC